MNVYQDTSEWETPPSLPLAHGNDAYWRDLGVDPRTVPYPRPELFAQGRGRGRQERTGPTLSDHLRGYGWSRMSWRVKALVVVTVLWTMGTINQRLDHDRTFNPPSAPVIVVGKP